MRVAPDQPLLHGASIPLERAGDLLLRLCDVAGQAGTLRLRRALEQGEPSPMAVIRHSVEQDVAGLRAVAEGTGVEVGALATLASVAAGSLLRAAAGAARTNEAPAPPGIAESPEGRPWEAGYCGVCGAWPALAEERGLERVRRLRCARCGWDWGSDLLRCPFCDSRDHRALMSMVVEQPGPPRRVAACTACRGYLKVLTTFDPIPPDEVMVEDLATVELDVVAVARGYARPERPGFALRLAP